MWHWSELESELRSKATHPSYSWKILTQQQQTALLSLVLAETAATLGQGSHPQPLHVGGLCLCSLVCAWTSQSSWRAGSQPWLLSLAGLCASTRRNPTQPKHTQTQNQIEKQAHHQAGVEFVEALHGPVAEAVAEVFLYKVGVVQDVICYQGLLRGKGRI